MLSSPYPFPALTPPSVHPRLMLTEADLPRIRENLSRPENADALSVMKELCVCPVTGSGATPEYGSYNLKEYLAVEALAFRALLSRKKTDADAAIEALEILLFSFEVTGGNMGARWGGHLIFVCSEVYDWCYRYISQETKICWIERCEEIAAAYFEMGYPPEKQAALTGHGTEAQLLRDLLAFSIAVYDERPDIYGFCAGRIFSEYIGEVAAYLGEGAHCQGPSYGSYRWTWLVWSELLFEAFSDGRIFGSLEKTADWLIYMTRPDGEALRLGDDFNETKADYNIKAPFAVPFFFAWALTGRKDFLRLWREGYDRRFLLPDNFGMDYYKEGSWGEGCLSAVSLLIFDRRCPETASPALPPAKYFGSPACETVFRSGDTHVFLKIGEFWGSNHDHLDTGCFQFYCGAPLLTDSGVYDSYGTSHRRQYLVRTSAHNCITVEAPDKNMFGEWKSDIRYDGGTKRPDGGREPRSSSVFLSDEYRMGYLISHTEDEDGCSLAGDLTPAYSHTCSSVIRRMTYSHPDRRLTVEDEIVSLDPSSVKKLHFHCQTEPKIDGDRIIIENVRGRAILKVSSPSGVRIEAVGGDGHAFEVDGVDFPPKPPYTAEAGWGQIIVSAVEKTPRTLFCTEITAETV